MRRGLFALLPLVALLLTVINESFYFLLPGASAQPLQQQQPEQQFSISTGQELADACAAYGRRNTNTLLVLRAPAIRLANASFTNVTDAEAAGGTAYSAGVLTIQGAGSDSTVLDAGMRAGLLPPPMGPSSRLLVLQDLSIINNCAINNVRGPGVSITVQLLLGLFSLGSISRSVQYLNASVYVRHAEIELLMYIVTALRSPWPEVRRRYQRQGDSFASLSISVRDSDVNTLDIASISTSGWAGTDMKFRSTRNPEDPLIQSMQRDGTLLPLRWCANGTLVPPSIADADFDPIWAPAWSTSTAEEALAALALAASLAGRLELLQLPVPAVFLRAPLIAPPNPNLNPPPGNGTAATTPANGTSSASGGGSSIQLAGGLQLIGPVLTREEDPSAPLSTTVLDLGYRSVPWFNLVGPGRLFISRVVLDGLGTAGTAGGAELPATGLWLPGLASTGPESASSEAWRVDAPIQVHNVTLVLPLTDYLALLTLATDNSSNGFPSVRGCMDSQVLLLASQLNSSVYELTLAAAAAAAQAGIITGGGGAPWQALSFSSYTAWGVNATQLLVRPVTPGVPAEVVARCAAVVLPPSDGGTGGSSGANGNGSGGSGGGDGGDGGGLSQVAKAGIIAGGVVGGVLLLGGLVAAAVVAKRRSRRQAHEKDDLEALGKQQADPGQQESSLKTGGDASTTLASGSPEVRASAQGTATATTTSITSLAVPSAARGAAAAAAAGGGGVLVSMLQAHEQRLLAQASTSQVALGELATALSGTDCSSSSGAMAAVTATGAAAGSPSLLGRAHATLMSSLHQGQRTHLDVARATAAPVATTTTTATTSGGAGGDSSSGAKGGELQSSGTVSAAGAAGGEETSNGKGGGGSGDLSQPLVAAAQGDVPMTARVKALTTGHVTLSEAAKQANKVIIHEVLGQGGSGIVYLGVWRGLPVAVKTMLYEEDPGSSSRQERGPGESGGSGTGGGGGRHGVAAPVWETALSASLGHPNVADWSLRRGWGQTGLTWRGWLPVATYHYDIKRVADALTPDGGAGDGLQVSYHNLGHPQGGRSLQDSAGGQLGRGACIFKVFLIQELCQSSLKFILDQGVLYDPDVPSSVNQALVGYLLLHIATGLEYLHGLGIIHGDLTPANVLLKLDASVPTGLLAKLADFGLSRRLDQQATHVSNFWGGTPFYVAPEVVHHRRTSPAADIYSLGVIMWQVMTGNRPFVEAGDGTLRLCPGFPSIEPGAGVPEALLRLMRRCLLEEPHARPTASELVVVLKEQVQATQAAAAQQQERAPQLSVRQGTGRLASA